MTDADKLVEDCARAIYAAVDNAALGEPGSWEAGDPSDRRLSMECARAALAVAVERCAVAVEDAGGDNAEYHAEKVRSLSPNAKGETHEPPKEPSDA